jgi:hypothetical protein
VSDDAPTLGEVVRRLDEVSRRLDDVSTRLDQREVRMAAEYQRRDVAEAQAQADAIQLRGLEAEQHSIGKRLDAEAAALARRLDTETSALSVRLNRAEDQRRQDRALLLGSLAFPLLVMLLGALFLSGRL